MEEMRYTKFRIGRGSPDPTVVPLFRFLGCYVGVDLTFTSSYDREKAKLKAENQELIRKLNEKCCDYSALDEKLIETVRADRERSVALVGGVVRDLHFYFSVLDEKQRCLIDSCAMEHDGSWNKLLEKIVVTSQRRVPGAWRVSDETVASLKRQIGVITDYERKWSVSLTYIHDIIELLTPSETAGQALDLPVNEKLDGILKKRSKQ